MIIGTNIPTGDRFIITNIIIYSKQRIKLTKTQDMQFFLALIIIITIIIITI